MRVALAMLGLVIVAAAVSEPATAATRCARWAAPYGDDGQAGTRAKPFRTVGRLASALRAGQTGCLAAGAIFGEHAVIGAAGAAGAPVRITSGPGPRATIGGGLELLQSARHVTIDDVEVSSSRELPAGQLGASVIVRGFAIRLSRSEVTGGNVADVERSCILVDHARRAVIDRNAIHDCGRIGAKRSLYFAGITVSIAVNATISDNTIFSNTGDAIALAPNAQRSTVTRNLLVGNGAGVYFSGGPSVASRHNRVTRNIIVNSRRYAVHGSYRPDAPVGRGNLVNQNCLWSVALTAGKGFVAAANRRVNPRVTVFASGFRLAPTSPCRAYRPAP